AWAAAACWVLADVYWSIGITGTPISQATNFFRISVVVFSLVSMLAFFRWTLSDWHGTRRRGPFGKALQLLGQHSFGVYLVHIFVQRRLQAISWTAGLFNTWYGCTLAIALILLLSLGLSVLLSRLRWGWLLVGTSTRGQYERTRPAVGA
ncbi:MAG: succinyl transferase OpgC, partial [Firmicutes bacterium]|nr:succinyl transferase OpgC [Bacillota bacterium]